MSTTAETIHDLDPQALRRNVQMLLSQVILKANFITTLPEKYRTQQYAAWQEVGISHEGLYKWIKDVVFEIRAKNLPLQWFAVDIEDREHQTAGYRSFFSIRLAFAEPIL